MRLAASRRKSGSGQKPSIATDASACREPGPLYKLSTNMVFSMGFAATSLGVARAMLDAATELARGKTPQGLKAMRDNNAVQGQIGRTEASLRRRACLTVRDGPRRLERSCPRRSDQRGASHRDPHRLDLDHPPVGLGGRHRLPHVGGDGGVCEESVRAPVSRHACDRAADPGPRHPV